MLRFGFDLRPLGSIKPWTDGQGGDPHLSWFGLTDGWYWIEVDDWQLFQYDDRSMTALRDEGFAVARPYPGYPIVRIWEDVQDILPTVLEPVPPDLLDFLETDLSAWDEDHDDPRTDAARIWHSAHELDTGHLTAAPRIQWWRVVDEAGDTTHTTWTHRRSGLGNSLGFTAPEAGGTRFSTDEFIEAVTDFDRRLIEAMEERVESVESGALDPGIRIDRAQLRTEQADRAVWLQRAMARSAEVAWDEVREGARLIRSGESTP